MAIHLHGDGLPRSSANARTNPQPRTSRWNPCFSPPLFPRLFDASDEMEEPTWTARSAVVRAAAASPGSSPTGAALADTDTSSITNFAFCILHLCIPGSGQVSRNTPKHVRKEIYDEACILTSFFDLVKPSLRRLMRWSRQRSSIERGNQTRDQRAPGQAQTEAG